MCSFKLFLLIWYFCCYFSVFLAFCIFYPFETLLNLVFCIVANLNFISLTKSLILSKRLIAV
ncbi:unnamed protein product [Meloidogyne enterolobii]|uniref:Uncharacterized protein n=1 Tax=Meloidogyne enterolobii TaxID=390850 RepID=A0ACB0YGK3_MELEN